jgi:hypothetical protein
MDCTHRSRDKRNKVESRFEAWSENSWLHQWDCIDYCQLRTRLVGWVLEGLTLLVDPFRDAIVVEGGAVAME